MKFAHDLAFVYIDLGDTWWRTAVTEMLRSAERVLPHARLVQLSDADTPIHPWSHKILRGNVKCEVAEFPEFKQFLIMEQLRKSELPTIYCGADNIWCGWQSPDIPAGAAVQDVLGLKRVHFHGANMRVPMIRFARELDGGKQFDEMAPTTIEQAEAAEKLRQDTLTLMELDLEKGPPLPRIAPLAGQEGFGAVNIQMPSPHA